MMTPSEKPWGSPLKSCHLQPTMIRVKMKRRQAIMPTAAPSKLELLCLPVRDHHLLVGFHAATLKQTETTKKRLFLFRVGQRGSPDMIAAHLLERPWASVVYTVR